MTSIRLARTAPVIGIDGSRLSIAQRTGTETYTWEILRALAALAPDAPIRLYLNARASLDAFDFPWESRLIPFPRFWTHARLSWEVARHPPSLLWVPAHVIPVNHPSSIVTVHDLGYLHHPEGHTAGQRRMLDRATRWSTRIADRIIAISETTKRDLVDYYHVPESRIVVIPHGASEDFRPLSDAEAEQVRQRYGLIEPFVLAVGTIQPRKNYDGLARAMTLVARAGLPHHLVIAGRPGWLADDVRRRIAESGANDRIRFLDYVPADDLPALYGASDVVAFPSWYEGFGLPAVEAMRCGVPVVVSNRGALPEVVGDAALIVEPADEKALAGAIINVASDAALRRNLVARGLARGHEYSWRASAERTLALLQERSGFEGVTR